VITHARILFLVMMQKNDLLMQDLLFRTLHSDLIGIRTAIALYLIENHVYQDNKLR
jgi:hypothetical protein